MVDKTSVVEEVCQHFHSFVLTSEMVNLRTLLPLKLYYHSRLGKLSAICPQYYLMYQDFVGQYSND